MLGDDLAQEVAALVGLAEVGEELGDLDVGGGAERALLRHVLVERDRLLVLLQPVVGVGERDQGQAALRREVERQAHVDDRRDLVALAAADGAEVVEHLGRALVGAPDQRLQRLAGLQVVLRGDDEGMARQDLVEVLVDLLRPVLVAVAREKAAVGIDEPQRALVGVIGGREAGACRRLVAQQVGDHPGVEIAEGDEAVVLQAVAVLERLLLVAGARPGPGDEQVGEHVAARGRAVLGELRAGRCPLVRLQRLHAEHEMGEPVGRLLR
jgi:hypothetical protein